MPFAADHVVVNTQKTHSHVPQCFYLRSSCWFCAFLSLLCMVRPLIHFFFSWWNQHKQSCFPSPLSKCHWEKILVGWHFWFLTFFTTRLRMHAHTPEWTNSVFPELSFFWWINMMEAGTGSYEMIYLTLLWGSWSSELLVCPRSHYELAAQVSTQLGSSGFFFFSFSGATAVVIWTSMVGCRLEPLMFPWGTACFLTPKDKRVH